MLDPVGHAESAELTGTVATIADPASAEGCKAPATIVVGAVVRLAEQLEWFQIPTPGCYQSLGIGRMNYRPGKNY